MRIRVLGGGWYGAHLASTFLRDGHDVILWEAAGRLFAGASGGSPARLHVGPHYPRSKLTRAACQDHKAEFMRHYGFLTRGIPVNIYAIAADESLVDFGTYRDTLRGEIELITVAPEEVGLRNVEGAIMVPERHIVTHAARRHFEETIGSVVRYGQTAPLIDDPRWDLTIDCTFAANDAENIDRYEPCLMVLLEGPTDKSVTIMDGPFGSIYAFDEEARLSSLTSAKYTPLSKTCRTYAQAKAILDKVSAEEIRQRTENMVEQMAIYWPEARDRFIVADEKFSIRAMPRSGADARLVDVVRVGDRALRVRAGKIDAIFHAERLVRDFIERAT